MRCAMRIQQCIACRILFLVGESTPKPKDITSSDVLHVHVQEALQSYMEGNRTSRPGQRGGTLTATLTTYLKVARFLEHAAVSPEPMIARADDDTFLSLHMLEAYAGALLSLGRGRVYAGVLEHSNWVPSLLVSTGWGLTWGAARARGRKFSNCSRNRTPASRCHGPFPFAKGPLLFVSRSAVRTLLRETSFATDVAAAPGIAARAHAMVHDDIALGAWFSQVCARCHLQPGG